MVYCIEELSSFEVFDVGDFVGDVAVHRVRYPLLGW
jgi:hypothetical protein